MNAIERYYKQAPPMGKNAIIIGGIAIGGIVLINVLKAIKRRKEAADANRAGQEAAQDIKEYENYGYRRTLTDSQLVAMVTALTEAMNDCGTDEQAIYNTFAKLNNDLDFLYLVKAFGVQYYRPCAALQPISYLKYLADNYSFGGDLPTWLNYDLSQAEIDKINSVLLSKGITFKF